MRTIAPRRRTVLGVMRRWRETRHLRETSDAQAIAEAVARGQAAGGTQAAAYAAVMNQSRP